MIVVIDDERSFESEEEIIYARSSNEGLATLCRIWLNQWIRGGAVIAELWLDHDLGVDDTIRPVVDWLVMMSFHPDNIMIHTIYVHSQNPVGAEGIYTDLAVRGYNVKRVGLPKVKVP